ncbi:unnamed protein product [Urochloa humidicola]
MPAGDPDTRPDVETVFVPSSFDLDRDARDWEGCSLVPWALHLPPGEGARAIEELLMEKLHLQRGDVSVTVHQPEPYLIRFERSDHCAAAKDRGRFQGHVIDICLHPWRSLTHAMGMRIFYRVRLCLDGIPPHAWTPEIVERIIGRTCALQCINTDLVQPRDTRHIDLWAWTANPSEIPKRVWLFITSRPSDGSSAVFITERPAECWHQGVRFQVFVHMPLVEDYTAAEGRLQEVISNPDAFVPVRRRYDWRYGLVDGAPPEARSTYPARLPRPPREMVDSRQEVDGDNARLARRDGARGLTRRGNDDGDAREGRAARGVRDTRGERDARGKRPERGGRARSGRSSCREHGFAWPAKRGDDGDDDYDHPGRGRDTPAGYTFFALDDNEPVRRERTRSPRRREGGFWRRRGWNDDHPDDAQQSNGDDDNDNSPAGRLHLGDGMLSSGATGNDDTEFQAAFAAQASALKDGMELAERFAHRLGIDGLTIGNVAWSGAAPDNIETVVPASRAFGRLRSTLQQPSLEEVDRALTALELAAAADVAMEDDTDNTSGGPVLWSAGPGSGALGLSGLLQEDGPTELGQLDFGPAVLNPEGSGTEGLHPVLSGLSGLNVEPDGLAQEGQAAAEGGGDGSLGPGNDPVAEPGDAAGIDAPPSELPAPSVDDLFTTPPTPVLQHRPVRAPRRRRTFDMGAVRRSARLAKRPAMSSMQHAQRNLLRKLGIQESELQPLEKVLQDYIKSIKGPMPDYIIAALSTFLDLDDSDADQVTEALLQHVGEGVAELQAEQDAQPGTAA